MKRVAIVSSYNEECGAAFYSSRLKKHLEAAGLSVEVLRLPVGLLRVTQPQYVEKKGDQEIKRIAERCKEFDAVFLQFEPGLYGGRAATSYRRAMYLLKSAKRAIMTVHGFERGTRDVSKIGTLGNLLYWQLDEFYSDFIYRKDRGIVRHFWDKVRGMSHVHILTFCKGDAVLLRRLYDIERVSDYPITYYTRDEVDEISSSTDREQILRQYGLDPNKKYYSVVGFLNSYKGHLTAIKALEYLPDDYHLAIIGGEHPQGLHVDADIGPYVSQLLAYSLYPEITKTQEPDTAYYKNESGDVYLRSSQMERQDLKDELLELSEFRHFMPTKHISSRVHFLGQVADDELPKFYTAMDYMVHPYKKTKSGQSGSGPATLAIEFGTKSLFSNAPVFREMSQYFVSAVQMFNIGNFVELADSIERYEQFEPELKKKREEALGVYNPKGMVDTYRSLIEG